MRTNTIHENGTVLPPEQKAKMEIRALSQQERIHQLFLQERRPLTPEEVHSMAVPEAQLQTVRARLTNLTTIGVLRKTEKMVEGKFGVSIHKWELNIEQGKLF